MLDANGTRHHALLAADEWQGRDGVEPGRRGLQLEELPFQWSKADAEGGPGRAARRGAAADQYGSFYWIDDSERRILLRGPYDRAPSVFWPAEPAECAPHGDFTDAEEPVAPEPPVLRGLTVTTDHWLVVGVPGDGLFAFDLHAGGPPDRIAWPDGFEPIDIAAHEDGGAWVLERGGRCWRLDRCLRVVGEEAGDIVGEWSTGDFSDAGGEPPEKRREHFPGPLQLDGPGRFDPVALIALDDERLLVLDSATTRQASRVHLFQRDRHLDKQDLKDRSLGPVRGYAFAYLPEGGDRGALIVASEQGTQAYRFRIEIGAESLAVELDQVYLPMRRWGGRNLVRFGDRAHYDSGGDWLPLLRHNRCRYVQSGSLVSYVLDGREPQCVWHRVLLDAEIPPGTGVEIETAAADDPAVLEAGLDWRREPDPYLRRCGAEVPYHRPYADAPAHAGTWESLLQQARGRYLRVRLRMRGSGRETPRLRAVRAYYPRFSYLDRYLPAIFRDEAGASTFLERFLANVEGLFTTLEDRIAQAQFLFDPVTAPAEFLDWLGGWLGVQLEAGWEEARRRLFLRHAVELFAQRGTVPGLIRAVRLAVDERPGDELFEQPVEADRGFGVRIVENFRTRAIPGVALGDPTRIATPGVVAAQSVWSIDQGSESLHRRYGEHVGEARRMPATALALSEEAATRWRGFLATLGFTYAEPQPGDLALYRGFLARRYRRVASLVDAHALPASVRSFGDVVFPEELPADGPPLTDWIQFVSRHLPIQRSAHRFTVLVPRRLDDSHVPRGPDREVVRRVVELQRPAHTTFDQREYWAMFRVGEARVGLDTLLDRGSRFVALALDRGYLAGSFVPGPHPYNVATRRVSDRDALLEEGEMR